LTFTTESDIPPDIDLREILESVFSQLGILKRGQVFPVPVLENIYLTAEFSEPYVFLHGDEVEFDVAKLVRIPDVVELPNVPDANVPDATFNTLFEPPPVARNLFPGKGRRLG
jgi:hypothetical protein